MASLAGHAVVWIAFTMLAVPCLARAGAHGHGGMDEQYNFLISYEFSKVQSWGIAGIAFLAFALPDVLMFSNPEPASR